VGEATELPDSGMDTGSDEGGFGDRGGPPADREEIAAFESQPEGDDIGPAVEDGPEVAEAADDDAPLPDQAPGGPSPDGEDPAFLGPEG
jgi:hypothetical protein